MPVADLELSSSILTWLIIAIIKMREASTKLSLSAVSCLMGFTELFTEVLEATNEIVTVLIYI